MNEENTRFNIFIPYSLDTFLYDYKYSKFIECNKQYANESIYQMGKNYTSDDQKNKQIRHGLKYVKSVLEGYKKTYWLAAGTLLGKMLIFMILKFK